LFVHGSEFVAAFTAGVVLATVAPRAPTTFGLVGLHSSTDVPVARWLERARGPPRRPERAPLAP
jgi:hypothetical protein